MENRLSTVQFWLWLGAANHAIALMVVAYGCVYSGFTCQGESMRDVLSIYAFTLLTPQLALEAILLLALFLVSSSLRELRYNWQPLTLFTSTLSLLLIYLFWQN